MNDHLTPASEQTRDPVRALFVGSVVPAVLVLVLVALLAGLAGRDRMTSVLVGGGMALLALLVGPVLHQLCRRLDPALTIGIVVLAYCTVVILLGIGFSLLNDTAWPVGEFAAAGVFVVGVSWVVGHMRAALRLRQALYQDDETTAGR